MKNVKFILTGFLLLFTLIGLGQQPFTAGNIVVYRIGDGSSILDGNASKVFLDEYNPSTTPATLVQSIQMPSVGQKITSQGDDVYTGMMTLSNNGKYLVVPGFNANLGISPFTGTAERSIGLVDFNGALSSITVIPNPNIQGITSAASDNGTNFWYTGSDGVEYTTAGSSSFVKILDYGGSPTTSGINIVTGRIYTGHAPVNGNLRGFDNNGLPTTIGQSSTAVPGVGATIGPVQFEFADLDPSIPGADVLYIAALRASAGGILKYSLNNSGIWESNGKAGSGTEGYGGLSIMVSGNSVTVFATRLGGNTVPIRGGELVSFTDNSGYGGSIAGTIPTVIASVASPDTKAFRGVALVPVGCAMVTGIQATNVTATQATVSWAQVSGSTGYEYAVTLSSTAPSSGTFTSANNVTETGLTNNLTYYAHVRNICSATNKSDWSTGIFVTSCKPPSVPLLNISISDLGSASIKWNQVFGASGYEYFISTDPNPPLSGMVTNDTSISVSNLNSVTTYYVHVRSDCGGGAYSNWITKAFTTGCLMPGIHLNLVSSQANIYWNKIKNVLKYEYALTATAAKPLSGTYTTDSFHVINNLREGETNYFHVRSVCPNGSVSNWNTINFQTKGVQVYPNPVNEFVNIKLNGFSTHEGKITVVDAIGRVVIKLQLTGSATQLDTRSWATGIYMVRFDDGVNKYTVKLMKN